MAPKKSSKNARKIFIRTVTYHYTGEVLEETKSEFVLVKAAWIADSGRFGEAMKTGVFSEVEPYPDEMEVSIPKGCIVDCVRNWPHNLPRDVK